MRLFGPFQQGQVMLLTPIWPAYTEAHQRDDHRWVRRTFRQTGAAFFALALGLAVAAWQSHRLLLFWVGSSAGLAAPALAGVVALWCLLQMAAQPFVYYLMGVGRLRELAWAGTPGFVASAALLFWGARAGTVEGVLEAGSAGLVLAVIPPLALTTFRAMRQHEAEGVPR
jgi:O-antigen/teichoic acid export membrane protein